MMKSGLRTGVALLFGVLSILVWGSGCRTNHLPDYIDSLEKAQVSSVAQGDPVVSVAGSTHNDGVAALVTTVVSLGASADTYDKLTAASDPNALASQINTVFMDGLAESIGVEAVEEGQASDTLIEIDVQNYGVVSASISSEVFFFFQIEARMIYLPERKMIWEYSDTLSMPLKDIHIYSNSDVLKTFNTMVNLSLLSDLTEEELSEIFEIMADEAGRQLLAQLREDSYD